jgi:hypothetical protein
MAEKVGVFNKLWMRTVESATPSSVVWQTLEFLQGTTLGLNQRIEHAGGMTGSRQMPVARTREVGRQPTGSLTMNPTPVELDALLPWCFGVAKDGSNDFILPESYSISSAGRQLRAQRDGDWNNYTNMVVGSVRFSANEGSFLNVSIDCQGADEASASNAPGDDSGPPTVTAVSGSPYVMSDAALTIAGTTYNFRQVTLAFDNRLSARFNNSLTATDIRSTGIQVGVQLGLPDGDVYSALYTAGKDGVAIVITFTNGSDSLRFTYPEVVFPKPNRELGTPAQLTFPLAGIAYRAADGTACCTVRHVNA